jgi:hypothetical protein
METVESKWDVIMRSGRQLAREVRLTDVKRAFVNESDFYEMSASTLKHSCR